MGFDPLYRKLRGKNKPPPSPGPTPPPVRMSGVEQDRTRRGARRDLRRTQSVFAGESGNKQTLG